MPTIGDMIQQYIKVRDHIEQRTAKFEEEIKPYKDGLVTIENAVHAHLNEQNEQSIKTEFGTAFKKEWTQVKMADKDTFIQWVTDCDDIVELQQRVGNFFTAAVSKEAVVEHMKETGGALPPGLGFTKGYKVNFRRAS